MNVSTIIQNALPHHACTNLIRKLTRSKTTWFKNYFIKQFIKCYDVDMSLALEPNYQKFNDFNDFFTRELKPDIRPISNGEFDIACPVDGTISEFGQIQDKQLIQAKNINYSLLELCGDNQNISDKFDNGHFMTIYLSPKDYHRVHMPFSGTLTDMIYIPGRLFSVNQNAVKTIKKLFIRNERVVAIFETKFGPMAVIFVGAFLVGSIATAWAGDVNTPFGHKIISTQYPQQGDNALTISRGNQVGHFNMGSTVILLFPDLKLNWKQSLEANSQVLMGEKIASLQMES